MPYGFWIGKIVKGKHFDIRDWQSKNIGATNVLRVLGVVPGIVTFFLDTAKSFVPCVFATHYFGTLIAILCLVFAVGGHWKSIYFFITERKFGGGKSVATAFGGMLAMQWEVALSALAIFILVVVITRYVSLGSILASFSAVIFAIIFRCEWYWVSTFGVVFLFIIFTHKRNIQQLLDKTELKFGQKRGVHGTGPDKVGAFGTHPTSIKDLSQSYVSKWLLKSMENGLISERDARYILQYSPVIRYGEIKGILDKLGTEITDILIGIFLMPGMIKQQIALMRAEDELIQARAKELTQQQLDSRNVIDKTEIDAVKAKCLSQAQKEARRKRGNREFILNVMLRRAAVLAKQCGATRLGLGALLSSYDGGISLQKWCDNRGLNLKIDNGGMNTAAAIIVALAQKNPDFANKTIAIIGASGVIGRLLTIYFKDLMKNSDGKLILVGKNEKNLRDLSDKMTVITTDLEKVKDADIIISTTSFPGFIISLQNAITVLKPDVVIMDVAVPADVDENIVVAFPELHINLIRCGVLKFPGQIETEIDMHFGYAKDGSPYFPACLGQLNLMLANPELNEPESIDWCIDQMNDRGYEVVASTIDERTLFGDGAGAIIA